jgi:glucose uptake protein GlcU
MPAVIISALSISNPKPMFVPHSLAFALLMMVTSAICWGSWANTYKGVKNYRFELFYWDYAAGIVLVSLVLAFTMGSTANDASSFLNNVHSADRSNFVYTLIGGAVFNLANLLLVAAIDMAGLATAFPVSIWYRSRRWGCLELRPSTQRKPDFARCGSHVCHHRRDP